MDANQLRSSFVSYFVDRGHVAVPSASLIPHDPTVLFTIAGMVPFKPYFLGEEAAPWPRATSVQKCFRTTDIDVVGSSERHFTFFEMLGNFSFGDYFKSDAIPYAWEFLTEVLQIDGERLWATVHFDDDEAAQLWIDGVGLPPARVQRMGDDNFWKMGDTGPCGPSSEVYFDRGEGHGREGGPAAGDDERYREIWNLVFMQNNRLDDGSLVDLPRKNIDTGAGLERILPVVQGVSSPFDTDLMRPILEAASSVSGVAYGAEERSDVSLRILVDHARAMATLVADGVLPTNEGRGYVLRRVIRRAVRHAHRLGVEAPVMATLTGEVVNVLGEAWPNLVDERDLIAGTVEREEAQFRRTLVSGSAILEAELEKAAGVSGELAFRLHDTHGFPIELTTELAGEAGVEVDLQGFEREMRVQRERAKADARARRATTGDERIYRELLERSGPTRFTGYERYEEPSRVVAVMAGSNPGTAEIVLDRTPFYAEGGGQVGDTGVITTETGKATVTDTQNALPGLIVHRATVEGEIFPDQDALAVIDAKRRERIRRNHTGTHLLHAALRLVLGDHVRQQGSNVAPDRLRFDFSHPKAVKAGELAAVAEIANEDVLGDDHVEVLHTTKSEAETMGALAFFEDKYGDEVRVVRAGPHSTELCGGTHVSALGMIGPVTIVSESSIGSNTRRIEATTGLGSLALLKERHAVLERAAEMLRVDPDGVLDALDRVLQRQRAGEKELQRLRSRSLDADAAELAEGRVDGVVVARRDGLSGDQLRDLAQAVRRKGDLRAVVLGGAAEGGQASIAASTSGDVNAGELVKRVASVVGGGGGGSPELAFGGGRDVGRLDEALSVAAEALGI